MPSQADEDGAIVAVIVVRVSLENIGNSFADVVIVSRGRDLGGKARYTNKLVEVALLLGIVKAGTSACQDKNLAKSLKR